MSWSFSSRGTAGDVKKFLDEQAPTAIAHVQGVERSIADQALGLARAVVAGNTNEQNEVSVSANGSASFVAAGQDAQALSITIQYLRK